MFIVLKINELFFITFLNDRKVLGPHLGIELNVSHFLGK